MYNDTRFSRPTRSFSLPSSSSSLRPPTTIRSLRSHSISQFTGVSQSGLQIPEITGFEELIVVPPAIPHFSYRLDDSYLAAIHDHDYKRLEAESREDMEMNEINRDQGLDFRLAQFQVGGSLRTRGEHEVKFTVDTQSNSAALLTPNYKPPGGELLLDVFAGEQDQQGGDGFKISQREVESEKQQDQSLGPIVGAHIGTHQLPMLEQSEKEQTQEYHSTHKPEQWQTTSEVEMVYQTLPLKRGQLRYPEGSQTRQDAGSKQKKKWETSQEQHQQQPQSDLTMNDTDIDIWREQERQQGEIVPKGKKNTQFRVGADRGIYHAKRAVEPLDEEESDQEYHWTREQLEQRQATPCEKESRRPKRKSVETESTQYSSTKRTRYVLNRRARRAARHPSEDKKAQHAAAPGPNKVENMIHGIVCNTCSKPIGSSEEWLIHIHQSARKEGSEQKHNLKCLHCGEAFQSFKLLRCHISNTGHAISDNETTASSKRNVHRGSGKEEVIGNESDMIEEGGEEETHGGKIQRRGPPQRKSSIFDLMQAVPGPQDGTFLKRFLEIEREHQRLLVVELEA